MKLANAVIENAMPRYTGELVSRAAQALASLGQTVHTWRIRARTRRALGQLSPRLLQDVGISPGDARREASRPFWR